MDSWRSWSWEDILAVVLLLTAVILLRWVLTGLVKRLFSSRPRAEKAFLSLINWFSYNGILVFIIFYFADSKWLFYELVPVESVDVTLFLIIVALLILTFAFRISRILNRYIFPFFYDRHQLDKGTRFTMERIIHYVIMIVAFYVSLTTVGIDLSALAVFAGVLGVGIGFGMQNIASNFISGLILLFERPIKVGDRVLIDDVVGDVQRISMRATIVRTIENEHIIIPNSYFLEEKVVNRSFTDPRLRLTIPVGVAYGSDVEKVKATLLQVAAEAHEANVYVLHDPNPFVNFKGFGDSSLDFELFVWISKPEDFIPIKSELNFSIYAAFSRENIEIPFPQRDLHIKSNPAGVWNDKEGQS
ncbi:mechanosensitive ion channel [Halobacillus halophilus]|nr:mechanosensitive ion channel [Halobacillus halophilus]